MVPEGWHAREIGSLAKFSSGGTPSKQNPDFWGGDHPWITAKDLKQHYLATSIDRLTDSGFEAAKVADKGCVLILVRGMTLLKDFPVGYATRPLAFNQDVKALVPAGGVDGLYLSFLLAGNKNRIKQLVTTAGHGTGRLDTDTFKAFPINLPPTAEQKRIARILAIWDEAITATERLLVASEKQKKALMQQLLTGKKRLPGFEGEWIQAPIGKLLKQVSRPVKWSDHVHYQLISVRRRSGGVFLRETLKGSQIKTKNLYTVQENDFLISKMQVVHGASALVSTGFSGFHVSGSYIVLIPRTPAAIDPGFLSWLSALPDFSHRAYLCSYGVHIEKMTFNLELFFKERLRIPEDVGEQRAIVGVLAVSEKQVEIVRNELDRLKNEKKALMQQLLTGKRRVTIDREKHKEANHG